MLILNYSLGFISFDMPRGSISARDAGAAMTLPTLTALCIIGQSLIVNTGTKSLSSLMVHRRSRSSENMIASLRKMISRNVKNALPFLFIFAALMVVFYFSSQELIQANTDASYRYILLGQALPLWLAILYFTYSLFIIYKIMTKHISNHLRVRLFEIEKIKPLNTLVLLSFSSASILLSVYSLQVFVMTMPPVDLVLITIALLLSFCLLIWPLLLIRSKLYVRREHTIDRINESLNIQLSREAETKFNRRLVDDSTRMQFISDLLLVRKEVADINLFPINLPYTAKLFMLFLLPFVSWVGAALVSQFLKVVVPV